MSGRVRAVPHILFAAKCDHANCAGKMSGRAIAFKGDSNRMRILSIFIDEQQGPLAVWAPNGIARDQIIPSGVFDSDIDGVKVMHAAAMRYPLFVDHPASVVESGIANDLGINDLGINDLRVAVPKRVAPDCPALAAMLDDAGFDRRMNVKCAALSEGFGPSNREVLRNVPSLSPLLPVCPASSGRLFVESEQVSDWHLESSSHAPEFFKRRTRPCFFSIRADSSCPCGMNLISTNVIR
jgi:hypothetical protein